jgi:hypothetical protein
MSSSAGDGPTLTAGSPPVPVGTGTGGNRWGAVVRERYWVTYSV